MTTGRLKLDRSAPNVGIVLGVCYCGLARFLACDETTALQRIIQHEAEAHPNDYRARSYGKKLAGRRSTEENRTR